MSRSDTAFLSLRIAAILIAFFGVASLSLAFGVSSLVEDQIGDQSSPTEFQAYMDPDGVVHATPDAATIADSYSDTLRSFYLYPGFTSLGFAALLFLLSRRIAGAWFPSEEGPASRQLDTYGAQAVAISILGLYLIATAIPEVGAAPAGPLFPLLKAAVGLALFFGSRRFAASWHRKAGVSHPQ